jgi:hypothetical protein
MPWQKLFLAVAAAAVVAATFVPTDASARHRGRGHHRTVVVTDYCGGRLPAYGTDACGFPEFGYGPDSCWRRVIVHTYDGLRPRRVFICSPRGRAS